MAAYCCHECLSSFLGYQSPRSTGSYLLFAAGVVEHTRETVSRRRYFTFSMTGRRRIEQRRRYKAQANTTPAGSTL